MAAVSSPPRKAVRMLALEVYKEPEGADVHKEKEDHRRLEVDKKKEGHNGQVVHIAHGELVGRTPHDGLGADTLHNGSVAHNGHM